MSYNSPLNRLCIYFFYDRDGKADRYVLKMLNAMRLYCSRLLVVSNGNLEERSRLLISDVTDELLERENTGFDVWAYKAGIEKTGWKKISEYDEVILMNHTIMGPVDSFDDMFREMDSRELDFWGITMHHRYDSAPKELYAKFHCIPQHIQSHFIAVRKRMLESGEFKKYWDSMPQICSYNDSVCFHEAVFTGHFERLGFSSSVYVDTSSGEYSQNPIIFAPKALIQKLKCPIFKRRSFFHIFRDLISQSLCNQGGELLDYLDKHTDYDVELIWENILRLENMGDIARCLNLNYVLPRNYRIASETDLKTALIMHLYYPDLFAGCIKYAESMPQESDIYLTVSSEENAALLRAEVSKSAIAERTEVRIAENRGRDQSSLFVCCKDVVGKYDLVCFAHDKKSPGSGSFVSGEAFSYHCFENSLASPEYVANVIGLFEKNLRLGFAAPPPPYHGLYRNTLVSPWGINFENTQLLAKKLGIRSKMSRDVPPITGYGSMFWFRPKALKKVFDADWKYEDFPEEPVKDDDGTLLHAFERIYPFAAQDEGFASGWIMNSDYAALSYNNFYNLMLENSVSPEMILAKKLKKTAKKLLPRGLWSAARRYFHK